MSDDDEMTEFKECSICICPFDENLRVPRLLQCNCYPLNFSNIKFSIEVSNLSKMFLNYYAW